MFCSMANPSSAMLEVSRVVGVEEEDELELSLGLSIGGSFRKPAKSKLLEKYQSNFNNKINLVSTNTDTDISQKHHCFSRSSTQEFGSEYAVPQAKHEILRLRRREARKRREEKLRNGLRGGTDGGFAVANEFSDDKLWWEAKSLQNRVRERKVMEDEALLAERSCKRGKKEEYVEMKELNLTLNHNESFDQTHSSNPPMLSSSPYVPVVPSILVVPDLPVQHLCPPLQYVPLTNGFVYPYAMPYWTLPLGEKNENDVFQPLACRSLLPDHRSPLSSLSGNSLQGDSSNDTKNHWSGSQSEHSASSNRIETTLAIARTTGYRKKEKVVSSNISPSNLINPNEQSKSETRHADPDPDPDPVNKFIPASENPTPGPLKGGIGDEGKPPTKPQGCNSGTPSLLQMPCVSTTGNVPDGKTIIGFLWRYTKTDVSILCACHGSSFSPAEFVEHAGGKDILHPLKHITVISSALG